MSTQEYSHFYSSNSLPHPTEGKEQVLCGDEWQSYILNYCDSMQEHQQSPKILMLVDL